MTDTPQHIYDLQLSNWLSKTPEERLLQFLKDNDDMRRALKKAKESLHLPDTVTNFPSTNQGQEEVRPGSITAARSGNS